MMERAKPGRLVLRNDTDVSTRIFSVFDSVSSKQSRGEHVMISLKCIRQSLDQTTMNINRLDDLLIGTSECENTSLVNMRLLQGREHEYTTLCASGAYTILEAIDVCLEPNAELCKSDLHTLTSKLIPGPQAHTHESLRCATVSRPPGSRDDKRQRSSGHGACRPERAPISEPRTRQFCVCWENPSTTDHNTNRRVDLAGERNAVCIEFQHETFVKRHFQNCCLSPTQNSHTVTASQVRSASSEQVLGDPSYNTPAFSASTKNDESWTRSERNLNSPYIVSSRLRPLVMMTLVMKLLPLRPNIIPLAATSPVAASRSHPTKAWSTSIWAPDDDKYAPSLRFSDSELSVLVGTFDCCTLGNRIFVLASTVRPPVFCQLSCFPLTFSPKGLHSSKSDQLVVGQMIIGVISRLTATRDACFRAPLTPKPAMQLDRVTCRGRSAENSRHRPNRPRAQHEHDALSRVSLTGTLYVNTMYYRTTSHAGQLIATGAIVPSSAEQPTDSISRTLEYYSNHPNISPSDCRVVMIAVTCNRVSHNMLSIVTVTPDLNRHITELTIYCVAVTINHLISHRAISVVVADTCSAPLPCGLPWMPDTRNTIGANADFWFHSTPAFYKISLEFCMHTHVAGKHLAHAHKVFERCVHLILLLRNDNVIISHAAVTCGAHDGPPHDAGPATARSVTGTEISRECRNVITCQCSESPATFLSFLCCGVNLEGNVPDPEVHGVHAPQNPPGSPDRLLVNQPADNVFDFIDNIAPAPTLTYAGLTESVEPTIDEFEYFLFNQPADNVFDFIDSIVPAPIFASYAGTAGSIEPTIDEFEDFLFNIPDEIPPNAHVEPHMSYAGVRRSRDDTESTVSRLVKRVRHNIMGCDDDPLPAIAWENFEQFADELTLCANISIIQGHISAHVERRNLVVSVRAVGALLPSLIRSKVERICHLEDVELAEISYNDDFTCESDVTDVSADDDPHITILAMFQASAARNHLRIELARESVCDLFRACKPRRKLVRIQRCCKWRQDAAKPAPRSRKRRAREAISQPGTDPIHNLDSVRSWSAKAKKKHKLPRNYRFNKFVKRVDRKRSLSEATADYDNRSGKRRVFNVAPVITEQPHVAITRPPIHTSAKQKGWLYMRSHEATRYMMLRGVSRDTPPPLMLEFISRILGHNVCDLKYICTPWVSSHKCHKIYCRESDNEKVFASLGRTDSGRLNVPDCPYVSNHRSYAKPRTHPKGPRNFKSDVTRSNAGARYYFHNEFRQLGALKVARHVVSTLPTAATPTLAAPAPWRISNASATPNVITIGNWTTVATLCHEIRIGSWNVHGMYGCRTKIERVLWANKVVICMCQETWLTAGPNGDNPEFEYYTMMSCPKNPDNDLADPRRGLCVLVMKGYE